MEENDDSGDANEAGKLRERAKAITKFRGGNLIPTNTTNCLFIYTHKY